MKPGEVSQPIAAAKTIQIYKLEKLTTAGRRSRSRACATWWPKRSTVRDSRRK